MKSKVIKTNNSITRRVIELHEKGFTMDFDFMGNKNFRCLQSDDDFYPEDISITVIDQLYDQFTKSLKYIHTIETSNGYKGVLLSDKVCTDQSLRRLHPNAIKN